MRDLRSRTDTDATLYRYTYTFTSGEDSERVAFVTDTSTRKVADELAWEELAADTGTSVDAAREAWGLDRVGICFADPPWDSRDEIPDLLGELDGVSYARELPHTPVHKPTEVHVIPENGVDLAEVEEAVAEFFAPLPREMDGDRVTVYPTALLNIER